MGETWQNRIVGYGEEAPDQLLAHPDNFRVHPKHQQDALAGVLAEVGVVQNILVNRTTGRLIDGHLRVSLALRDGQPSVPVTYVELSEAEERLVLATLDPIAALATTDAAKLDALLRDVSTGEAAVQAMLAGLAEEAGILGGLPEAGDDAPVEVDETSVTRTQPGDVWRVGRHTVACLDSTDRANVERLVAGRTVGMVWSDAPYGISIVQDSKVGASNLAKVGTYAPVAGDDTTETAERAAALYLEVCSRAVHIWWGANNFAHVLPPSTCWVVWDKENTGNFADAELAWTNHDSAVRIFKHQWNGMIRESERGKRVHPTQKPIALCAWAFDKYGAAGDVILDPFLGSGPSLKAAETMGRTVIGFELSPHYVDHILEWAEQQGIEVERTEGKPLA